MTYINDSRFRSIIVSLEQDRFAADRIRIRFLRAVRNRLIVASFILATAAVTMWWVL